MDRIWTVLAVLVVAGLVAALVGNWRRRWEFRRDMERRQRGA
jgi:hypothetical protein